MATPSEIIAEAQCTVCSGTATMFETLAITMLKQITGMTQSEIEAESGCWICYGVSQAEAAILVLLNNLSGGASGGSEIVQSQSGNYAGGEPNWVPTTGTGIAWDTSTDPDTIWYYYDGAWH